ncbi:MAG: hypothetical protein WC755_00355 [Candidatus Woesearchaeota archaeon]|jgi:hypothetical protein
MTLDIVTAKKYLSNVDKKSVFKLKRGHELYNLSDLYEELKISSDDDFKHHVNENKNDFANWVAECIGDTHLSESMRETKDKEKTLEKIKARLFVLKLMTILKEDFVDNEITEKDETKAEKLFEKELDKIEKESHAVTFNHDTSRHDISNLKNDKGTLKDIRQYISEMEQHENDIVKELSNIESENKGLKDLFKKNFSHGFLLGMTAGILVMIIGLKILLMVTGTGA